MQQKKQQRTHIKPLEQAPPFVPQAYASPVAADPFSAKKMAIGTGLDDALSAASKALMAPELKRVREPLESIPLENLVMVGRITKADQTVALIWANQMVHQVRIGHYLGMNFGRITRIDEKSITLREIISSPTGQWVESKVTLVLQEVKK